ncbi:MAG: pyridoxamine 5'-phosphate oxidase family protein [Streptosporangiaceae bacterium]
MQSHTQHPGLQGWQRLAGRWATEAIHPALPGIVVTGHATFEWLEDQRFLIWRSHYDHPEIPDAIAVTGIIDGKPSMHYFDPRGVHRTFAASITAGTWRFWNDAPGFSQRFTGVLSEDGDTITGHGQLSRDGSIWEDDLAITYRRSPAGPGPLTGGDPGLNAMARRVIDANQYMTLATTDPGGRPRLSPVYYTPARHSDFYWVSSPEAQHSRNLAERPGTEIVIFDSTAPAGQAEAVYITATARAVHDDELEALCPEAFRTSASARRFTPDDLRGGVLQLYVARARSCEVHVAANHPVRGRGVDTRQQANPTPAN